MTNKVNLKKDLEMHCVAMQETIKCGYVELRAYTKHSECITTVTSERVYLKTHYTDKDLETFLTSCDIDYDRGAIIECHIWFQDGGWAQMYWEDDQETMYLKFYRMPEPPTEIMSQLKA